MADNPIDEDQAIAARIAPVMAAAADRIHYAESRRANYSVMAGVLVAAGIAIFTFAFGSIDSEWLAHKFNERELSLPAGSHQPASILWNTVST